MKSNSISENLVYQRKLKGYTQEELSAKTSVTVRTIQRIEKGNVQPHLQTVKLLAVALEVEIHELLPLENPKQEKLEQKWLLFLHAGPILGLVLPFFNILLPFFIWIHKRDDNRIFDMQGRVVFNFHLSMSIIFVLSLISLMVFGEIAFYFFLIVIPFSTATSIVNAVRAVNSKKIHYPLTYPFLKKKNNWSFRRPPLTLIAILFLSGCQSAYTETTIAEEKRFIETKILQNSENDSRIKRIDGTTIGEKELTEKIDHLVKVADVTGLAVAILNQNETTYFKTFGYKNIEKKEPLERNTVMYGASLSKAIFSIIVLQLWEEGKIDLDVPLQEYLTKPLPDYKFSKSWKGYNDIKDDKRYETITARMALSHTTGFPNWRFLTKKGFDINGKLYFQFDPGKRYSYSGEGFSLLQFVIEEITGKGLEELAQERVFRPLGMENTSYIYVLEEESEKSFALGHDIAQQTIPFDEADDAGAAGSLGTTPEDYSTFLEAVMKNKLIKKSTFRMLREKQIDIRSKQQFGPNAHIETSKNQDIELAYGLGWGLLESPYGQGIFKEGHGEGFQHYSILFADREIGILIMSNSDNAESIFKELLEISIADVYTPWKWENYIPYDHK